VKGKWSRETCYAVTSLSVTQATPGRLAAIIRGQRGIEDRLRCARDIDVDEDLRYVICDRLVPIIVEQPGLDARNVRGQPFGVADRPNWSFLPCSNRTGTAMSQLANEANVASGTQRARSLSAVP
jgi:hypothetical protein